MRKVIKKDYKDLLDQGAIIIDVRTESEYKSGAYKEFNKRPLKRFNLSN